MADKSPASWSRRDFLSTTGSAVAGIALGGMSASMATASPQPKRGGTLRFATRMDGSGLDPHRTIVYPVSMPLAATSQGLLDLSLKSEPAPGVAAEWTHTPDLLTYTFKLRKGAQFHNGREIDAAAVKWNFERIKNPKTSHAFQRSALKNLKEVVAVDKYTLRCHLHAPSAAFPANVVYYPCSLMAPDSEAQADRHPIGCGPFKFVRWERYRLTEVERFENYFETDADGNSLPYLDRIIVLPKREDHVRLTALRTGEVELIDQLPRANTAAFVADQEKHFQTWSIPTLGTAAAGFNVAKGPFRDKRLRLAAAHAIDREAILQAVYYGQGEVATGFYASASPWHVTGARPGPEYDPDKARFLLRQAKGMDTEVVLIAANSPVHHQQTGELLQAMWTEVGFKVAYNAYDRSVRLKMLRSGEFHAVVAGMSYRFDPDGWYSRQVLSTSPITRWGGFRNERADKLIVEARRTADKGRRLALYAEVDSIINDDLPYHYLINSAMISAGSMRLKGYQPAISGPFITAGGGIRAAWLA